MLVNSNSKILVLTTSWSNGSHDLEVVKPGSPQPQYLASVKANKDLIICPRSDWLWACDLPVQDPFSVVQPCVPCQTSFQWQRRWKSGRVSVATSSSTVQNEVSGSASKLSYHYIHEINKCIFNLIHKINLYLLTSYHSQNFWLEFGKLQT